MFQPDSCDQMLSRQSNSEDDRPYFGISTRASALGSAALRFSDFVWATPEALESARALPRSASGRRSSVDREARSSRSSSSTWLRPLACDVDDRAAADPSTGLLWASTPVETARPVAATATPENTAAPRMRRTTLEVREIGGVLRCLAAYFSDKGNPRVDGMGRQLRSACAEVGRGAHGEERPPSPRTPTVASCTTRVVRDLAHAPEVSRSSVTRVTWSCARASRSPARRSAIVRTG